VTANPGGPDGEAAQRAAHVIPPGAAEAGKPLKLHAEGSWPSEHATITGSGDATAALGARLALNPADPPDPVRGRGGSA
jgi:hypothetical protein